MKRLDSRERETAEKGGQAGAAVPGRVGDQKLKCLREERPQSIHTKIWNPLPRRPGALDAESSITSSFTRPPSLLLFSRSVLSDSLPPHGLQHAGLPCPSPTPRVCSNSCPLSRGCHPTISSSVVPFSSCPQSFPGSGSFLMSWLFTPGGQNIGVSASVLSMNIQG